MKKGLIAALALMLAVSSSFKAFSEGYEFKKSDVEFGLMAGFYVGFYDVYSDYYNHDTETKNFNGFNFYTYGTYHPDYSFAGSGKSALEPLRFTLEFGYMSRAFEVNNFASYDLELGSFLLSPYFGFGYFDGKIFDYYNHEINDDGWSVVTGARFTIPIKFGAIVLDGRWNPVFADHGDRNVFSFNAGYSLKLSDVAGE